MKGQRILVTGGAGFIGSNFANALAEANDVVVIDNEYLGTPENLDDAVDFDGKDHSESSSPRRSFG